MTAKQKSKLTKKEKITSTPQIDSFSHTSNKEPQTMDELLDSLKISKFALKRQDTVEGKVISKSPGEVLIDIGMKSFGILAEWELEQVKEYAKELQVGDKVVAQVMNPENDTGYVVLSLRKSSMEGRWQELMKKKDSGEDVEVIVLEIAKGGILVDWKGLRGFIPFTQLEGSASTNPSVLISKKLTVKVLEVDRGINRLVLSQKAALLGVTPAAQREKLQKIKLNDTLKGTISGIAPFGLFVDIDGLEGLVHISEIAWEKVDDPAKYFKVNDEVEVLVLEVNMEEGKLNLSIKRLTPDPWKNILDRYPVETTVSGKVVRIAPYGVFMQIEPGIEGLLHVSKLTSGEEPKKDETIECMIETIDTVRRKISLAPIPKAKPVGYR